MKLGRFILKSFLSQDFWTKTKVINIIQLHFPPATKSMDCFLVRWSEGLGYFTELSLDTLCSRKFKCSKSYWMSPTKNMSETLQAVSPRLSRMRKSLAENSPPIVLPPNKYSHPSSPLANVNVCLVSFGGRRTDDIARNDHVRSVTL